MLKSPLKELLILFSFYFVVLGLKKAMTEKSEEIDITARTLWGEARGEGTTGMQAVANVIRNRVNGLKWFGSTFKEVCLKPRQFSAWEDLNRPKMLAVDTSNPQFRQAVEIAKKAVAGTLPDITNGANHYHAVNVKPSWADTKKLTVIIGNHAFYKL